MSSVFNEMVVRFKTEGADKTKNDIRKVERELDKTDQTADKLGSGGLSKLSSSFKALGVIVAGVAATFAAFKGVTSIISTASEFESLETRLTSLYGSTERAAEAFEKFRVVAAKTPATLKEVVNAGATLKAFGMDAENTLTSLTDLASYMGVNVTEAAGAVGRAFAGGVGAADMLRERGIINLVAAFEGVSDISKYTLPEFRRALLEAMQDPTAGIAGAADRLSKTFEGAKSNFEDTIDTIKAMLGKALLPELSPFINELGKSLTDLTPQLVPLVTALTELGKSIVPVLTSVAGMLAQAFATLLPIIVNIISALTPLFGSISGIVGSFTPVIAGILKLVAVLSASLMPIISKVVAILTPVIGTIADLTSRMATALVPVIESLAVAIEPILVLVAQWIAQYAYELIPVLELVTVIIEALAPAITAILQVVTAIIKPMAQLLSYITGNTDAFKEQETEIRSLTEIQREYENSINAVVDETRDSLVQYDVLVTKLRTLRTQVDLTASGHAEMSKVVGELQRNYGQYIGKINLEKGAWDSVSKALETARNRLIEYNVYKVLQGRFDAEIENVAKLTIAYQKQTDAVNALASVNSKVRGQIYKEWQDRGITAEDAGAMGGVPMVSVTGAKPDEKTEAEGRRIASETEKKLKEATQNLGKLGVKVELAKASIIDLLQVTAGTTGKAAGDMEKAAGAATSTAKSVYEELTEIADAFHKESIQGIKQSRTEQVAEWNATYQAIIDAIKVKEDEKAITVEQANALRESLTQDHAIRVQQLYKDMGAELLSIQSEQAGTETAQIEQKYAEQEAIIQGAISDRAALIKAQETSDMGLNVAIIQAQIDALNQYLITLKLLMAEDLTALTIKDAEERIAMIEKEKTALADRANAYLSNMDSLKLSYNDFMTYQSIVIDQEIANLERAGMAYEDLRRVRADMLNKAGDEYQEWANEQDTVTAGFIASVGELMDELRDQFIDGLTDAWWGLVENTKSFSAAMTDIMHNLVETLLKELTRLMIKMMVFKALQSLLGGPGAAVVGSMPSSVPAGFFDVPSSPIASTPSGPGYLPISNPSGGNDALLNLVKRLESAVLDNKPIVYTQLIEGLPLRNAVKRANLQANMLEA